MLHDIFEDEVVAITARHAYSRDNSGAILLSFTGIGHEMGDINVQHPEFFGAGQAFDNTIFISDKTRSWGNRIDFPALARHLEPFLDGKDVYGIGNSMGGFLALIASHFIPMKRVLAFAPQFSIDPQIVPWETRWSKFTRDISQIVFQTAGEFLVPETQYYIFSGGRGDDLRHAQLFPVRDNIHHFLFTAAGHGLAAKMKDRKMLKRALHRCFAGETELDIKMLYSVLSPSEAGGAVNAA